MTAQVYPDDWTVKDALQTYFSRYHFENGGYHLKWFRIKIGPVFIPLPNTKGRIAAVKIHDIHHLATEYPATLKGEAEIGGWEIATGCGPYLAAWVLNFGSFFYGLLFFPRALFRAFMHGRSIRTSLYHGVRYDDELLQRSVGDIRRYIGFDDARKNNAGDYVQFLLYGVLVLGMAAVFFFCLLYWLPRFLFWN